MTITKFAHSCLLVEEAGVRILIDPGSYSSDQNTLTDLYAILITHVHGDHCDVESVRTLVASNPDATIYANPQVQAALQEAGIESKLLGDGEQTSIGDVSVEGFGADHIEIHSSIPLDRNTGYLIAGRLFHPGDNYTIPPKPVEILALPTGGPWLKIGDTIDYALAVKPKRAFPIHDGMFKDLTAANKWPMKLLSERGIHIEMLELGRPTDF